MEETQIKKLTAAAAAAGFTVTDRKDISYGIQLNCEKNGVRAVIRLYRDKKGRFTLDTSQLKNEDDKLAVAAAFGGGGNTADIFLAPPLIGSDEAGKGDYIGALTVCAVYADEKMYAELIAAGVKDSKRLSDAAIDALAVKIKTICPYTSVVRLENERFNEIYAKVKNMNVILAMAHAAAIKNVHAKSGCKNILIDKFGNEERTKSIIGGEDLHIVQHTGGEANAAVAAASILARRAYMKNLAELSAKYGVKLIPGAGEAADGAVREFIAVHGTDELNKIVKISYKNTDKILADI